MFVYAKCCFDQGKGRRFLLLLADMSGREVISTFFFSSVPARMSQGLLQVYTDIVCAACASPEYNKYLQDKCFTLNFARFPEIYRSQHHWPMHKRRGA
jgi:hypothetical protein